MIIVNSEFMSAKGEWLININNTSNLLLLYLILNLFNI